MMFSGTTPTTDAAWRRSSKCSIGSCVEVLVTEDRIFVRDSKQTDRGADQSLIDVDPQTWRIFLSELLGLTTVGANGTLTAKHLSNGWVQLVDTSTGISLSYDQQEWTAFIEGVAAGEMALPVAG